MGIIRLTLITAVLIWLAMMYFGRDEGLPEHLIGRDTTPAPAQIVAEPAPAPAEEPAPRPATAPPPQPQPQPAADATAPPATPDPAAPAPPLANALEEAVSDALATPAPEPEPVAGPASQPEPAAGALLEPAAAPEPAIEPEPDTEWVVEPEQNRQLYVTGNRVNVRSGPSTVYGAITSLTRGTAVVDLGDAGEGWRMIRLPSGETAYMSGDFLSPVAP